jgi:glycosyltransferase involved in cell wall biosynthesis
MARPEQQDDNSGRRGVVHAYHNPTGARIFAAPMVARLTRAGIDAELWCSPGPCPWLGVPARASLQAPVRYIPSALSRNPLRSLLRLVRLARDFRQRRPRVVHAHLLRGATLPLLAAWLTGVPQRIYHNHGLPHLGHHGPLRWALRSLELVNRCAATHLLMVSHSNLQSARADGLEHNATVLGHGSAVGVDLSRFGAIARDGASRRSARQSFRIAPRAVVFGYAGRPVSHKGLSLLARAWERSGLVERGALALLAGVRPAELQRLVGAVPPGVLCVGPLEAMDAFYATSDVVVLTSRYEGFGYSLLEGAAAGLPGIGSDVPGIRCAIEDGVTGLLVPSGDVSALAQAMQRLAEDVPLRQRMGAAALARASQNFRNETVLDAMLKYYQGELGLSP